MTKTFKNYITEIARWSWRKLLKVLPESQREKFFKNRDKKAIPKKLAPNCQMILHSSVYGRMPLTKNELLEKLRNNSSQKLAEGIFTIEMTRQAELTQASFNANIVRGATDDPEERHLMMIFPTRIELPDDESARN